MKFIRNVFTLLIAALTLLLGVLFALQNQTPVPLDLLVIRFEEQTLAVWILLAFLAGGLLGIVSSFGIALRARRAERRLRRQLAQRGPQAAGLAVVSGVAGHQPGPPAERRIPPSTLALSAARD
jgi:lipopolysaccharide assembly protein A